MILGTLESLNLKLTKLIFESSTTISDRAENLSPKVKIKLNDSNHIF